MIVHVDPSDMNSKRLLTTWPFLRIASSLFHQIINFTSRLIGYTYIKLRWKCEVWRSEILKYQRLLAERSHSVLSLYAHNAVMILLLCEYWWWPPVSPVTLCVHKYINIHSWATWNLYTDYYTCIMLHGDSRFVSQHIKYN